MALQNYHFVWLAAHPGRTEEWLRERMRDGFHIHHIDGDHSNDAAANLVLIEGGDHLRLHGMPIKPRRPRKARRNTPYSEWPVGPRLLEKRRRWAGYKR